MVARSSHDFPVFEVMRVVGSGKRPRAGNMIQTIVVKPNAVEGDLPIFQQVRTLEAILAAV